MILGLAVSLALWVYCGALSLVAREEHPLFDRGAFHAAAVAGFLALLAGASLALGRLAGGGLFVVPVALIGAGLGLRYWSTLVGFCVERSRAGALGIDRMKVERTYDRAAKAESERRWAEAVAIYLEEAAVTPEDPEPLRRAAEACVRWGRPQEACAYLRRALALSGDADRRAAVLFRLTELLSRELGRTDDARSLLEADLAVLRGTRYEEYARERLRAMPVT